MRQDSQVLPKLSYLKWKKASARLFGACPSMGTANTMQMLGEVLNLVMPGTSTIPASDNARLRAARTAGKYMVQLAKSERHQKI